MKYMRLQRIYACDVIVLHRKPIAIKKGINEKISHQMLPCRRAEIPYAV